MRRLPACAGLENPLDNSAVPRELPDSETDGDRSEPVGTGTLQNKPLIDTIEIDRYKTGTVGNETLNDILQELENRAGITRHIKVLEFDPSVRSITDLKGDDFTGIVTNITNFGCFVDVGIKENGLVHISELANRFVSNPSEVVSLHQHVKVKVLSMDLGRGVCS